MEYFALIGKSVLFYILIIFALRLMGKREIGELSVLDIVVYLVMSELLALAISDDADLLKTIIPIFTLTFSQIAVSFLLLKLEKMRDVIEGKPTILIKNGIIDQNQMKKHRYSVDDLLYQLRDKDVSTIEEVEYAILENSGTLTVFTKQNNKLRYPFPLICDGIIQQDVMEEIEKDEQWLMHELKRNDIHDVKDVFLALWQKNNLYLIKKSRD